MDLFVPLAASAAILTNSMAQHLPAQNAHDREHGNQPQIAELNALNAAMAVIRFKQHMGFFDGLTASHAVAFDVAGMAMDTAA